ncbi:uncharacterized protein LACBIDRAFT_336350 [Laccaria bicolor S238N-H82]|uniref:Predicted protein n=1 Tax=Laccaria bicolor (strain S238N-H82 / ATCC MYA-4686) TaxID=486041 RepID=B0E573_LACBS|nr:uncharacterized protein LACBIDRAFT_336350 [Laccaria bicolor S238N-H82]EDQ98008.1 predicted protein [Laccaria bicolor S238N-H82]|eukprot:XP_001891341.1 predicted protein [Laccaria bicolor S238N-H82]
MFSAFVHDFSNKPDKTARVHICQASYIQQPHPIPLSSELVLFAAILASLTSQALEMVSNGGPRTGCYFRAVMVLFEVGKSDSSTVYPSFAIRAYGVSIRIKHGLLNNFCASFHYSTFRMGFVMLTLGGGENL